MDREIRCVICAEESRETLYVAGPSITVCAKCVLSAVSLLLRGNLATAQQMARASRQSTPHCSFCGKLEPEASGLVGHSGITLCAECLGKSVGLMAQQALGRAERNVIFAIPPHGP